MKIKGHKKPASAKVLRPQQGRKGGPVTPTHSPGVSLSPSPPPKTSACIPRLACLLHSELPHPHWLRPGREGIGSAESQMLGLKGEPDSKGSSAKLGLCVTSMITRIGSRKGGWEARGPSAFHRIQRCLRLSTLQGYLKPNPLGSAPSSAT